MLISKFNKLIQNKFVWAIFAVLVSASMVGLFAPSIGGGEDSEASVGKLFDRPVSAEELMQARFYEQSFQPIRGGEAEAHRVNEQAWLRLAIRRYASKLGIQVSDRELSQTIAADPSFRVDGQFNPHRYRQLVEGQMGIPLAMFEDYLRDEILMGKMEQLLGLSLWIPLVELEQSVARFTDIFSLQYIHMDPDEFTQGITVSVDDAKNYHERHPELFESPEKRKVLYVHWSVDDLTSMVNISEDRLLAHYDRHIEDYSVTDTNTMAVSYRPFEEVEEDIRTTMERQEAMSIAGEFAMQFLGELSMLDYDDDVSMHSVASLLDVNVQTSEWFHATTDIPGISAGNSFNEAAFRLDPDQPSQSYSSAIIGDEAVYLLAWYTNQPSTRLAFDEVEERALELALQSARETAFQEQQTKIHSQLSEALKTGTSFLEAAVSLNLKVESVKAFSIMDADADEFPFFAELAPIVLDLSSGEMSDVVTTLDAALIAFVENREAGDVGETLALKPDINRMLMNSRMNIHFGTWADYLITKARGAEKTSRRRLF